MAVKTTIGANLLSLPAAGSRKLVAFGDSIAAGFGLDDETKNYLYLFSKNIGASYQNFAVSGYDSGDLLKLLTSPGTAEVAAVASANIIVLSIGGNDILHQKDLMINTLKNVYLNHGDWFTPEVDAIYAQFEKNFASCLDALRAQNPGAVILLQTVYNPAQKQGYYVAVVNVAKGVGKYLDRLNESIKKVCAGRADVYVIDDAERMNKDADNFYSLKQDFDIHPTEHGHASLAAIYTKDFNQLLSKS